MWNIFERKARLTLVIYFTPAFRVLRTARGMSQALSEFTVQWTSCLLAPQREQWLSSSISLLWAGPGFRSQPCPALGPDVLSGPTQTSPS